jgi:hypothetical protein
MIVATTKGLMDDSLLEKREGWVDNDQEYTTWIEYWDGEELVHRSVHVTIKEGVGVEGAIGGFSG